MRREPNMSEPRAKWLRRDGGWESRTRANGRAPTGPWQVPIWHLALASNRMKTCIFIGMTIGSALGWWLGEFIGLMTAVLVSGVGGVLGVYYGWRFGRNYFE